MTHLALIAVFGVFALFMLYVTFLSCRSARLRAVAKNVQEEVAGKLRREAEATETIVNNIVAGLPIDQVVVAYQEGRAAILTHDRTDKPWAWSTDDLEQWRKCQLRHRADEVNRKLMVPAVASTLLVLAICSVTLAVFYSRLSPEKIGDDVSDNSTILLPPLGSPESTSLNDLSPVFPSPTDASPAAGPLHELPAADNSTLNCEGDSK